MKLLNQDPDAFTEAREAADLTKTALARRLGCSLSLISEIEGGSRNAQPALLRAAAKVLGVPVASLKRRGEPSRTAAETASHDVRELRHAERAESPDVSELLSGALSEDRR